MREIKFRAWQSCKPGYVYKDEVPRMIDLDMQAYLESGGINGDIENMQKSGIILMQFTGLKDTATGSKNGKDIYEGDIVKFKAMILGKREDAVGYVHFNTPSFEICLIKPEEYAGKSRPMINWIQKEMEVIGNIYENPELLGSPTESAGP